jgi:hypothetical protein
MYNLGFYIVHFMKNMNNLNKFDCYDKYLQLTGILEASSNIFFILKYTLKIIIIWKEEKRRRV